MGDDDLLHTRAAALRLGLATTTLEKWRVSGQGPRYCKLGRSVRYRSADLTAWLTNNVVGSTSEKPLGAADA
jgi:predicted DNA-binding transcriptional regulator AlpA